MAARGDCGVASRRASQPTLHAGLSSLHSSWRQQHRLRGSPACGSSECRQGRLAYGASHPLRHRPSTQLCSLLRHRSSPWLQQRRPPIAPAAAVQHSGGGQPPQDDGQPPAQPQPADSDPELPANLDLSGPGAASSSPADLLQDNPFQENPFSDPELRAERGRLNQLHAEMVTQLQQAGPATPAQAAELPSAAAGAGAADASSAASVAEPLSAAAEGLSKEEFLVKVRESLNGGQQQRQQQRQEGQQRVLPQPLAAVWAALMAVLARIRGALAAIPAMAHRQRLASLKKVSSRSFMEG